MINDLIFFVEVVNSGSFSKAAARIQYSTSQISRRVAKLEEELDVKLLNRTTRAIKLTEAGNIFYQASRDIIERYNRAKEEVSESEVSGLIRLSAPLQLSTELLSTIIARFSEQNNDIKLVIDLCHEPRSLINENFDLGLRLGPFMGDSSYKCKKLYEYGYVICASPQYLKKFTIPKTPKDLLHHRCIANITTNPKSPEYRWTFYDGNDEIVVSVNANIEVSNYRAQTLLTIAGSGVARLPVHFAQPYLNSGRLRQVLADFSIPSTFLYAIFPSTKRLPKRIREFLDFLSAELQKME